MPSTSSGQPRHQLLEQHHRVAVVGVGLVELEHRELGVVPRREALVAEDPPDLEHLVEAADHEALEVELGRHAQVEVGVERVVVRDERARRGPAGDRVQQRRLHLDETLLPQPLAHAAHHVAAQLQDRPAALVRPQVDVALAVAHLGVGHPAPLVAEVAPRLGQQLPLGHLHRELAALGAHDLARGPDPVAQVERGELVEARGQRRPGEQLDDPELSRSSAKASLPWGRESMMRPATPTVTPDSSPGASADQASTTAAGLVRAIEAVRDAGSAAVAHALTLRSYTMRRPCRVSQGSTCSIVSEYGAMSELNPPVATTVEGPSSSMKRRASASTRPAKP